MEDDRASKEEHKVAYSQKRFIINLLVELPADQGTVHNAPDELKDRLALLGLHLVPVFADHCPQLHPVSTHFVE